MAETQKIYTVEIYLKSQEKPIEYRTTWPYINENELNDGRIPFIKIEDNYFRKEDILKILLVNIKEKEVENEQQPTPF